MSSSDASPISAVTNANWIDPPHHREGLRRVAEFVDVAAINNDPDHVRELSAGADRLDPSSVAVAAGSGPSGLMWPTEERISAEAFFAQTATDAVIVLRGDEILHERYYGANGPEQNHIVFSVSKSFCGMLAGILIADGVLDAEAAATRYVPELLGGAYDGASVQQLLDMTARPHYSMDYLDPSSEVHAGDRAAGWRPAQPGDIIGNREYLATVQGHEPHGEQFYYCSATTDVLAWVLERATGSDYATLMSQRLWSRLGAEADAYVTVDPKGAAYACAGMGMRLRDLARFGRLVLDQGRYDGRQVIPSEWIATTRAGGDHETADDPREPRDTYKNQWWIPGRQRPSFYAVGIFGQYLWLDPVRDVVIAKFASEAVPRAHDSWHLAGYDAIARAASR
jgi:6-aminohexanoate-oligomer exohydrolase